MDMYTSKNLTADQTAIASRLGSHSLIRVHQEIWSAVRPPRYSAPKVILRFDFQDRLFRSLICF